MRQLVRFSGESRVRFAAFLLIAMIGFTPGALACAFHGYIPQDTIVDHMLASDHIVLARPAADNEFRYEAVEALVGDLDGVDIPHLVDTHRRRLLTANADHAVLFARDPADGRWRALAYLDPDFREVVEQVVARLPDWASGDDAGRPQMFADLHDHANPGVREVALLELDRVEYAVLRTLNLSLNGSALQERLNVMPEAHLRAIRVLLIGLAGDESAKGLLADGITTRAFRDLPLVGAYATAWLELDGAPAVRALAEQFLLDPEIGLRRKRLIVEAMAIHSQGGDPATRHAVTAQLRSVLAEVPELAPVVAQKFGARNDWSQRDALAATLRTGGLKSLTDVLAVSQYVALATNGAEGL